MRAHTPLVPQRVRLPAGSRANPHEGDPTVATQQGVLATRRVPRRGKWFARWKGADGSWVEQATSAKANADCKRLTREMVARVSASAGGVLPLLGCPWPLPDRLVVAGERSVEQEEQDRVGMARRPIDAELAAERMASAPSAHERAHPGRRGATRRNGGNGGEGHPPRVQP